MVDNIRRIAYRFGDVTLFKAYLESTAHSSSRSLALRSELQASGVSLTDCPHNGRKDVADKMILGMCWTPWDSPYNFEGVVDMLAFAIDNEAPATIVLISGDRDFAYAVSMLRLRRYCVVIIAPSTIHDSLKLQASVLIDWSCEILGKDDTEGVTFKKPNSFDGINPSNPSMKCEKDQTTPPTSLSSFLPPPVLNSFKQVQTTAHPGQNNHTHAHSSSLQSISADSSSVHAGVAFEQPPTSSTPGVDGPRMTEISVSQQTRIISGNTPLAVMPQGILKLSEVNRPNEHAIISRAVASSETGSRGDRVGVAERDNTLYLSMINPKMEASNINANPSSPTSMKIPAARDKFGQASDISVRSRAWVLPSIYSDTWSSVRSCPGTIEHPTSSPLPDLDCCDNKISNGAPTICPPTPRNAPAAMGWHTMNPVPTIQIAGRPPLDTAIMKPSRVIEDTTPVTSLHAKPVPSEFQILVKELRRQQTFGRSSPTRSVVAGELVKQDKLVYKRAKVNTFKNYITFAVKAQIVVIGGAEGNAWISLHPSQK